MPWGWWLGEGGVGTPPRFGSQAQPRCLQPPMGLTWSRAGGPPERRSAWCLEPWHRATARSPLRCRRGVLGCRPPLCSELSREAAPAKDLWTVQRQHCSASGKAGRLAIQGPWSPGLRGQCQAAPPPGLMLPARGFPATPASALMGSAGVVRALGWSGLSGWAGTLRGRGLLPAQDLMLASGPTSRGLGALWMRATTPPAFLADGRGQTPRALLSAPRGAPNSSCPRAGQPLPEVTYGREGRGIRGPPAPPAQRPALSPFVLVTTLSQQLCCDAPSP